MSRWVQYLYFLRFSILGWLFLPILCALDYFHITASLTRGIVTVDSGYQAFYAAFFIVATNMAVLITVRTIVRNGKSRFRSSCPSRLYDLVTDPTPRTIWLLLLVAHIPTLFELGYVAGISVYEEELFGATHLLGEHSWNVLLFLGIGVIVALIFWYLVSLFYYWTYRPYLPPEPAPRHTPVPAALIFPHTRFLFGDIADATPPPRLILIFDKVNAILLRRIGYVGYAPTVAGPVWELHFLSGLSLAGIFALYLFLYPLTAPVTPSSTAFFWEIVLCIGVTALFLFVIADSTMVARRPSHGSRWAKPVHWTFILLAVFVSGLFMGVIWYDHVTGSVRLAWAFPTLASILVLHGFLLWLSTGASFFLDRFRVPVLTTVLVLVLGPKVFTPSLEHRLESWNVPWLARSFDSDHYFTVKPLRRAMAAAEIPTPASAVQLRVKSPNDPYIVVTASGGGIHAAEWTAQVMAQLEAQFADDPVLSGRGYTFHDHLLLASGVSGGSVGLMPFLLEYTAHQPGKLLQPAPIFSKGTGYAERITRAPGCSSLEAVGWGLAYFDFSHLLAPIHYPSSAWAATELDRSWSLAQAFNRNLHDEHCQTDGAQFGDLPPIADGEGFTLRGAALKLDRGTFPAFTFNTTAAETGGRFLLSNYYVPKAEGAWQGDPAPAPLVTDFVPSESFLQAYATDGPDCCSVPGEPGMEVLGKPLHYADLPLATAARLSATFPIVSSGTRIPSAYTPRAYHFLDGGYYDNDGTASAIEFLKSALDGSAPGTQTTNPQGQPPVVPQKILLIEIRDDDGITVSTNADDLAHQNAFVEDTKDSVAPAWTPIQQLTGVLGALWNAGHVSIARRNRSHLCVFEHAYAGRGFVLHHVVFTITNGKDEFSPLSWNLTKSQLRWIVTRARSAETRDAIQEAIEWVKNPNATPADEQMCRAWVEPPPPPDK